MLKAEKIPEQDSSYDSGIYVLGYIQEFLKKPDLFIEDLIQDAPPRWSIKPSELRTFWRETILGVQMKDGSRFLEVSSQPSWDPIINEAIEAFLAECSPVAEHYTSSPTDMAATLSGPLSSGHSPVSSNNPVGLCNALDNATGTGGSVAGTPDRSGSPSSLTPPAAGSFDVSFEIAPHLNLSSPSAFQSLTSSRDFPGSTLTCAVGQRTQNTIANGQRGSTSTEIEVLLAPSGCCPGVPPALHLALADPSLFNRRAAEQLFPFLEQLSRGHLQRYAELLYHAEPTRAVTPARPAKFGELTMHTDASSPFRRRRASLSDLPPSKKPRIETPPALHAGVREENPSHVQLANNIYPGRTLDELGQSILPRSSHGMGTDRLIHKLLGEGQHPGTDSGRSVVEALFCTGNEGAPSPVTLGSPPLSYSSPQFSDAQTASTIVESTAAESDTAESDVAESDAVESDVMESGATDSVMVDSDVMESDAAESDVAESDAAESDVAESDAAESDVAESDVAESDAVESDVAESDVAESDAVESDVTESDAAESDVAESDAAESDVAESVMANSDVMENDTMIKSAGVGECGTGSAVDTGGGIPPGTTPTVTEEQPTAATPAPPPYQRTPLPRSPTLGRDCNNARYGNGSRTKKTQPSSDFNLGLDELGGTLIPKLQALAGNKDFGGKLRIKELPVSKEQLVSMVPGRENSEFRAYLAMGHAVDDVGTWRLSAYQMPAGANMPGLSGVDLPLAECDAEAYLENMYKNPPAGRIPYYVGTLHGDEAVKLQQQFPSGKDICQLGDLAGITTLYGHMGAEGSGTAFHCEDAYMRSYNLTLVGIKIWIFIDPDFNEEFEELVKSATCCDSDCNQFIRHAAVLFPLSVLREQKIGFRVISAGPGEMVVTRPREYHAVINRTTSFAIATNFVFPGEEPIRKSVITCVDDGLYHLQHPNIVHLPNLVRRRPREGEEHHAPLAVRRNKPRAPAPKSADKADETPAVADEEGQRKDKGDPSNLAERLYKGTTSAASIRRFMGIVRLWRRDQSGVCKDLRSIGKGGEEQRHVKIQSLDRLIAACQQHSALFSLLETLASVRMYRQLGRTLSKVSPAAIDRLLQARGWDKSRRPALVHELSGYRKWERLCTDEGRPGKSYEGILCFVPAAYNDSKEEVDVTRRDIVRMQNSVADGFRVMLYGFEHIERLCEVGSAFQRAVFGDDPDFAKRAFEKDDRDMGELELEELVKLL